MWALAYKASGLVARTFPGPGRFARAQDSERWCSQGEVYAGAWTQASGERMNDLLSLILSFFLSKNGKFGKNWK